MNPSSTTPTSVVGQRSDSLSPGGVTGSPDALLLSPYWCTYSIVCASCEEVESVGGSRDVCPHFIHV